MRGLQLPRFRLVEVANISGIIQPSPYSSSALVNAFEIRFKTKSFAGFFVGYSSIARGENDATTYEARSAALHSFMTKRSPLSLGEYPALAVIVMVRLLTRLLTIETVSSIGAHLAGWLGPRTRRHKLVMRNLQRAFPEQRASDRRRIAKQMWSNFGRTIAESLIIDR